MKEGSTIKVNLKVKTKGKERQVGESSGFSGGLGGLNLEEDNSTEEGFGEFQDSNW